MTIWLPQLNSDKPLYLAIADALERDVEAGILQAGDRLPPQRDLAWKLKITVGTVSRAYAEAEIRGLLTGEVGRGSYVRARSSSQPLPAPVQLSKGHINLCPAVPPRSVLTTEFDAALAHIMRTENRLRLLDYAKPQGNPIYRSMGQKWLRRCGLEVDEQNILTTAGAHIGVIVSILSLMELGSTLLAEELNYPSLPPALKLLNCSTLGLAMDQDGLIPEALEQALRTTSSRLLYIVPTHQNPTTCTMPLERRQKIVEIARAHDVFIIEDDVFRLLDPTPQPPCFYQLAPERTFYITSLSKALAPGLRIGFIATPEGRSLMLRHHQKIANANAVGIPAEVARYWLETDIADSIIARSRHEMARRRQVFIDIFKNCDYRFEPYAVFGWLKVPAPWLAEKFTTELEKRGVHVIAGHHFNLSPRQNTPYVRIGLGEPEHLDEVVRGLKIIRSLMDELPHDFVPMA